LRANGNSTRDYSYEKLGYAGEIRTNALKKRASRRKAAAPTLQ
jgi:hypothetical protein